MNRKVSEEEKLENTETSDKPLKPAGKASPGKALAEVTPPDPRLLALAELLQSTFGDAALESVVDRGMVTLVISPGTLLDTCQQLKTDPALSFDYLACLTSIDRQDHLEVAYNLRSLTHKHEFCLKVRLPRDTPEIPTVTSIWKGANWHEREAYDLMGIHFQGHPDLRRILLPDEWEGHPLRKYYVYEPDDVPSEQGPPEHLLIQLEGVE